MHYDIKDKVILITGANRGIGKTLVDSFIERGAKKVYAAVRTLDTAKPLSATHGNKIAPIRIDLEDPKSITAAALTAKDVEVVVNNAGVLKISTPLDVNALESLEFEMNVNVYGLIRMIQAFAPILKANGGGAFVQMNSVVSMKCFSDFATYSASKAASYSITQALRDVLRRQKTIVLSVHPGPIATDMGDAAGLTAIAEPPLIVAKAIIEALEVGDFHVFPGSMAKQIGSAYRSFADSVIEADISEE